MLFRGGGKGGEGGEEKEGRKRGGKGGEKERGKEKAEIRIVYCHQVIDTYSCLPRISFLANARAVITPHSSRTEITMCTFMYIFMCMLCFKRKR